MEIKSPKVLTAWLSFALELCKLSAYALGFTLFLFMVEAASWMLLPSIPILKVLMLIVAAHFASFLMASVLFTVWTYRVSNNCHAKTQGMQFNPMLAGLSYFLPVACLVLPYLVIKEILAVSEADVSKSSHLPTLMMWWGCWISQLCLFAIASLLPHGLFQVTLLAVVFVLAGTAALYASRVVNLIARGQELWVKPEEV